MIQGMGGRWQFSLKCLMAEVTLLGLACGFTELLSSLTRGDGFYSVDPLLGTTAALGTVLCWGGFIGGLFGRVLDGAVFAVCAVLFAMLLLPAVPYG